MDPRTRGLLKGVAASLLGRGIGAAGPLLLVPITLKYLGTETYGFWMAVTALTAMVVWADLGLGNGLLTRMSRDFAVNDHEAARRNLASAYTTLSPAAIGLVIALALVLDFIPWARLFNASSAELAAEPGQIVFVCTATFLLNVPLSLVQRAQYALDQVAESNLLQGAGVLLSLATTWILAELDAGPLPIIAAAVSGPLLGSILNSLWFYGGRGRCVMPRVRYASRKGAMELIALGSKFLALSVVTSTALNIDNLIVTHTLGLTAVTEFAIAARLFAALGLLINIVNLPLWPANSAALARGEHEWVRKTTNRMTVLSATAVAIPGLALTAVGPEPVMRLLGATETPPRELFLALTLWWTLIAAASPRFMVQNARAVLAPQAIGWLAYLLASVPLKAAAATSIGIVAVPVVGAALYAVLVWPGAVAGYRRALAIDEPGNRTGSV